jgi:hypothetical protein
MLPPVSDKNTAVRRLNLTLSSEAYNQLAELARSSGTTMKEVMRLGLALTKIVLEEAKDGNKLIIETRAGHRLKEIVLPR